MGDKKSAKKTIKTRRRIKEYCSYLKILEEKDSGNKEKSILEPSSGGIGTRLNMPKARLIRTMIEVIK